jgi:hypothetical protein
MIACPVYVKQPSKDPRGEPNRCSFFFFFVLLSSALGGAAVRLLLLVERDAVKEWWRQISFGWLSYC